MSKISLKYVEDNSLKSLSFSDYVVQPLGFDDLAGIKKLDQPIRFPLRLDKVHVDNCEFEDIDGNTVRSVSATLESTYGSNIVGLLKGGWLPSGLALDDALVLPDRCTVAAIRSRFLGGKVKQGKYDDFLNFAANHPLKINPMLYAMEGTTGRTYPDETELSELFDRASRLIQEALPNAIIFPAKAAVMRGAIGLLRESAATYTLEQHFLVDAVPLVAPTIGRAKRASVWRELFGLAQHHGVKKTSILMLTLLSATAAKQRMNPAKILLKPKQNYTAKNAFNALSDLRALSLLIAACADFPDQRVALLTEDRALSLLWTGLQAHNFKRDGNHIHCDINPHRSLFSNLTEAELGDMFDSLSC